MNFLGNLSFRLKLLILLVLSVSAVAGSIAVGGSILHSRMMAGRAAELQAVVDGTVSEAQTLEAAVVAQKMTREQAMARLAEYIHALRFDRGQGYVSVLRDGFIVVHGAEPERENKISTAKLPDGRTLWAAMQQGLRKAETGTVSYVFPRPGQQEPQPKISYFARFKPWDVVFNAGAYADDVAAEVHEAIMELTLLGGTIMLLTMVAAWAINRDMTRGMAGLIGSLDRLAAQDLTVETSGQGRRDEIGRMAKSVERLKGALLQKGRLEADAEAMQAKAETARERAEAEQAQEAARQAELIEQLGDGLSRLAEGNLAAPIERPFAAGYERLRQDYNSALEKVRSLIADIVGGANSLRAGAYEITQAADDLSRRTEQQAASLQQTAATMGELTQGVQRTVVGVESARDAVSTARSVADRSGEVVNTAVTAMGEIEHSAQQISQIIGVIDEIAFQTNLLALNAGVEAARAGEAGRGFAVVASEVRALAQRSGEAAREIKGLIATSSAQVGRGVSLVGETGKALGEIVSKVGAIDTIVSEIAVSAKEQATGLSEINGAIGAMDQVTQQNAAMVEESTAASYSLVEQSDRLLAMTSRFQLGAGAVVTELPAKREPRQTRPAPRSSAARPTPVRGANALAMNSDTQADSWAEF